MALIKLFVASFAMFCCTTITFGQEAGKEVKLQVGDKAPKFSGTDDQGKDWNSQEVAGKKILVVYFYPADMTGGCTKQACSYRDAMKGFSSHDVEIVGVSGDGVENHRHFKNEYDLNFTLLADEEGKIAKAFGVKTGPGGSFRTTIEDKEITLERGVTTNRWTFVIDKNWKIAYKDTSVNPTEDAANVLKAIEKL